MWYFSWILGTGLALSFAVLNAIWYEIIERQPSERIIESSENGIGANEGGTNFPQRPDFEGIT
jgi:cyd operon protein YbgT